ncbi:MAG: group II intron reverse transcriptase/maturase [Streptosporangiaceae bacterium]
MAGRDKEARFTALLHHVTVHRLMQAFDGLKKRAAPGVDGVTWHDYEQDLHENLRGLHARVQSGRYRAKPSRRVYIPKADGRQRPLAIAALEDKIVQRAVTEVLNAVFEADFRGFSYGFRPGRSPHDALDALAAGIGRKRVNWVLDADIRDFFGSLDRDWLMKFLRHRIADERILRLIMKWLAAGVIEEGQWSEPGQGSPQGAILSPLLANIALSALDDHFDQQWHRDMGDAGQRRARKKKGMGNWRLVRYCDDFVIMVGGERHHAEALRAEVAAVLAPLGLRLAPEKTRVVHVDEGFTFLGFDIRRMRKRGTSKYYVYTKPSKKAVQSIKDKVRVKTYRSTRYQDLGDLLADVNRSLAGWANYFRHGVSKATFSVVDSFTWNRLMRWIRAKYAGKTRLSMKELRRRFCDQGWRFAHKGVVFTGAASVTVTRYRYRGSNIPTPWTPKPAAAVAGG